MIKYDMVMRSNLKNKTSSSLMHLRMILELPQQHGGNFAKTNNNARRLEKNCYPGEE